MPVTSYKAILARHARSYKSRKAIESKGFTESTFIDIIFVTSGK